MEKAKDEAEAVAEWNESVEGEDNTDRRMQRGAQQVRSYSTRQGP